MARGTGNRANDRGAAYVWAEVGPPEVDTVHSVMDMPRNDRAALLHCPDIRRADADLLAAKPDVFAFPPNLQNVHSSTDRPRLTNRLGRLLGDDFDPDGLTYEAIIDEVMARICSVRRFAGERERHPNPNEIGDEMPVAEGRRIIADRKRVARVDLGLEPATAADVARWTRPLLAHASRLETRAARDERDAQHIDDGYDLATLTLRPQGVDANPAPLRERAKARRAEAAELRARAAALQGRVG